MQKKTYPIESFPPVPIFGTPFLIFLFMSGHMWMIILGPIFGTLPITLMNILLSECPLTFYFICFAPRCFVF